MQQPLPAATAAQNALKDVHARESNLNQLRMHQDECMLQAQKKKTDEKKDTLRSSPQKAATPRRSPRKAAAALSSPPRSPAPSSVPHESTVVGEPLLVVPLLSSSGASSQHPLSAGAAASQQLSWREHFDKVWSESVVYHEVFKSAQLAGIKNPLDPWPASRRSQSSSPDKRRRRTPAAPTSTVTVASLRLPAPNAAPLLKRTCSATLPARVVAVTESAAAPAASQAATQVLESVDEEESGGAVDTAAAGGGGDLRDSGPTAAAPMTPALGTLYQRADAMLQRFSAEAWKDYAMENAENFTNNLVLLGCCTRILESFGDVALLEDGPPACALRSVQALWKPILANVPPSQTATYLFARDRLKLEVPDPPSSARTSSFFPQYAESVAEIQSELLPQQGGKPVAEGETIKRLTLQLVWLFFEERATNVPSSSSALPALLQWIAGYFTALTAAGTKVVSSHLVHAIYLATHAIFVQTEYFLVRVPTQRLVGLAPISTFLRAHYMNCAYPEAVVEAIIVLGLESHLTPSALGYDAEEDWLRWAKKMKRPRTVHPTEFSALVNPSLHASPSKRKLPPLHTAVHLFAVALMYATCEIQWRTSPAAASLPSQEELLAYTPAQAFQLLHNPTNAEFACLRALVRVKSIEWLSELRDPATGWNAIHFVAAAPHGACILEWLYKHHVVMHKVTERDHKEGHFPVVPKGSSCLQVAVARDRFETVQFMLTCSAPDFLDWQNGDKQTAKQMVELCVSGAENQQEYLRLFQEWKPPPDPEANSAADSTPMDFSEDVKLEPPSPSLQSAALSTLPAGQAGGSQRSASPAEIGSCAAASAGPPSAAATSAPITCATTSAAQPSFNITDSAAVPPAGSHSPAVSASHMASSISAQSSSGASTPSTASSSSSNSSHPMQSATEMSGKLLNACREMSSNLVANQQISSCPWPSQHFTDNAAKTYLYQRAMAFGVLVQDVHDAHEFNSEQGSSALPLVQRERPPIPFFTWSVISNGDCCALALLLSDVSARNVEIRKLAEEWCTLHLDAVTGLVAKEDQAKQAEIIKRYRALAATAASRLGASSKLVEQLSTPRVLIDLSDSEVKRIMCELHQTPIHVVSYASPCDPGMSASVAPGGLVVMNSLLSESGFLAGDSGSEFMRRPFDSNLSRMNPDQAAPIFVIYSRDSHDCGNGVGHYEPMLLVPPDPSDTPHLLNSQIHPFYTGRCVGWVPVLPHPRIRVFAIPNYCGWINVALPNRQDDVIPLPSNCDGSEFLPFKLRPPLAADVQPAAYWPDALNPSAKFCEVRPFDFVLTSNGQRGVVINIIVSLTSQGLVRFENSVLKQFVAQYPIASTATEESAMQQALAVAAAVQPLGFSLFPQRVSAPAKDSMPDRVPMVLVVLAWLCGDPEGKRYSLDPKKAPSPIWVGDVVEVLKPAKLNREWATTSETRMCITESCKPKKDRATGAMFVSPVSTRSYNCSSVLLTQLTTSGILAEADLVTCRVAQRSAGDRDALKLHGAGEFIGAIRRRALHPDSAFTPPVARALLHINSAVPVPCVPRRFPPLPFQKPEHFVRRVAALRVTMPQALAMRASADNGLSPAHWAADAAECSSYGSAGVELASGPGGMMMYCADGAASESDSPLPAADGQNEQSEAHAAPAAQPAAAAAPTAAAPSVPPAGPTVFQSWAQELSSPQPTIEQSRTRAFAAASDSSRRERVQPAAAAAAVAAAERPPPKKLPVRVTVNVSGSDSEDSDESSKLGSNRDCASPPKAAATGSAIESRSHSSSQRGGSRASSTTPRGSKRDSGSSVTWEPVAPPKAVRQLFAQLSDLQKPLDTQPFALLVAWQCYAFATKQGTRELPDDAFSDENLTSWRKDLIDLITTDDQALHKRLDTFVADGTSVKDALKTLKSMTWRSVTGFGKKPSSKAKDMVLVWHPSGKAPPKPFDKCTALQLVMARHQRAVDAGAKAAHATVEWMAEGDEIIDEDRGSAKSRSTKGDSSKKAGASRSKARRDSSARPDTPVSAKLAHTPSPTARPTKRSAENAELAGTASAKAGASLNPPSTLSIHAGMGVPAKPRKTERSKQAEEYRLQAEWDAKQKAEEVAHAKLQAQKKAKTDASRTVQSLNSSSGCKRKGQRSPAAGSVSEEDEPARKTQTKVKADESDDVQAMLAALAKHGYTFSLPPTGSAVGAGNAAQPALAPPAQSDSTAGAPTPKAHPAAVAQSATGMMQQLQQPQAPFAMPMQSQYVPQQLPSYPPPYYYVPGPGYSFQHPYAVPHMMQPAALPAPPVSAAPQLPPAQPAAASTSQASAVSPLAAVQATVGPSTGVPAEPVDVHFLQPMMPAPQQAQLQQQQRPHQFQGPQEQPYHFPPPQQLWPQPAIQSQTLTQPLQHQQPLQPHSLQQAFFDFMATYQPTQR